MMQDPQVTTITSAGPIWQIQCRCQSVTQPVKDGIYNWCSQYNVEAAVIRGKSQITAAKERVVIGISESVGNVLGTERSKGKGKGKQPSRITTCWPDQKGQFAVIADGFTMAAGRIDFAKMEYAISLSERGCVNAIDNLGHSIREFHEHDRTGFMLPFTILSVPDLADNDWGRRPYNMNAPRRPDMNAPGNL